MTSFFGLLLLVVVVFIIIGVVAFRLSDNFRQYSLLQRDKKIYADIHKKYK